MTEHSALDERIEQLRTKLQIEETVQETAAHAAAMRMEAIKGELKTLYTERSRIVMMMSGVECGDRRKLSERLAAEIMAAGQGWWGEGKLARFSEFTVVSMYIGEAPYWEKIGLPCYVVLRGNGDEFCARLETVMSCEKVSAP